LIAFFGSAYNDVVDSAEAVYSAFFCQKVASMVRAPDQYVYLPPFNLLEATIIAPWEWVLSRRGYSNLNHLVQSTLFSLPLLCIAFYESRRARDGGAIRLPLIGDNENEQYNAGIDGTAEDPIISHVDGSDNMQISTIKFEDLVQMIGRT
jgi:hypothetical protein